MWTATRAETSGTSASVRRVADRELPSFDLVVATVDRVTELGSLFESLEQQTHRAFRVLLVDQNDDDRIEEVLRDRDSLNVEHLRSKRGLSVARNAALGTIEAQLVAFPDDDCILPYDLLERVARRFAADSTIDGLTGRAVTPTAVRRRPGRPPVRFSRGRTSGTAPSRSRSSSGVRS